MTSPRRLTDWWFGHVWAMQPVQQPLKGPGLRGKGKLADQSLGMASLGLKRATCRRKGISYLAQHLRRGVCN